jgi:broad specificity phosphatase PhoE
MRRVLLVRHCESIRSRARAGSPSPSTRLAERRVAVAPVADLVEEVRRGFDDPDRRLAGGESARDATVRGRTALDAVLASSHRLPLLEP